MTIKFTEEFLRDYLVNFKANNKLSHKDMANILNVPYNIFENFVRLNEAQPFVILGIINLYNREELHTNEKFTFSKLYDFIMRYKEAYELTGYEVARRVGVAHNTLLNWARFRKPNGLLLIELVNFYNKKKNIFEDAVKRDKVKKQPSEGMKILIVNPLPKVSSSSTIENTFINKLSNEIERTLSYLGFNIELVASEPHIKSKNGFYCYGTPCAIKIKRI